MTKFNAVEMFFNLFGRGFNSDSIDQRIPQITSGVFRNTQRFG